VEGQQPDGVDRWPAPNQLPPNDGRAREVHAVTDRGWFRGATAVIATATKYSNRGRRASPHKIATVVLTWAGSPTRPVCREFTPK